MAPPPVAPSLDPPSAGFAPTSALRTTFITFAFRERAFLALLGLGFFLAGAFYQNAEIARWLGFVFAAYAAVGNDSIQTIGTFIASNRKQPWWLLWAFMGGIFVATMTYSWVVNGGDVSFGRLSSKGFSETPTSFAFLSIAAPLFLIMLTRLKMPVSTTFLLLTSLSTEPKSIAKVINKSLMGYGLAFGLAIVVFFVVTTWMQRWQQKPAHRAWRVGQWVTSGLLWSAWLSQDAANVAVYLPRSLGTGEFLAFLGVIVLGLGLLFRRRGESIQEVVEEKSNVVDVRAATLIDLIYAGILYYFKIQSNIPMSTTWVFIGLLAGRELAMAMRRTGSHSMGSALRMVRKDLLCVLLGLLLSLAIAVAANPGLREALLGF